MCMFDGIIAGNKNVFQMRENINIFSWRQKNPTAAECTCMSHIWNYVSSCIVCRYLCVCGGSGASSRDLLLLWQRESWWVYAGGLGSEVDRERYWEAVCHALRKFFSQEEEVR